MWNDSITWEILSCRRNANVLSVLLDNDGASTGNRFPPFTEHYTVLKRLLLITRRLGIVFRKIENKEFAFLYLFASQRI